MDEELLNGLWTSLGGADVGSYDSFRNDFEKDRTLREKTWRMLGGDAVGSYDDFEKTALGRNIPYRETDGDPYLTEGFKDTVEATKEKNQELQEEFSSIEDGANAILNPFTSINNKIRSLGFDIKSLVGIDDRIDEKINNRDEHIKEYDSQVMDFDRAFNTISRDGEESDVDQLVIKTRGLMNSHIKNLKSKEDYYKKELTSKLGEEGFKELDSALRSSDLSKVDNIQSALSENQELLANYYDSIISRYSQEQELYTSASKNEGLLYNISDIVGRAKDEDRDPRLAVAEYLEDKEGFEDYVSTLKTAIEKSPYGEGVISADSNTEEEAQLTEDPEYATGAGGVLIVSGRNTIKNVLDLVSNTWDNFLDAIDSDEAVIISDEKRNEVDGYLNEEFKENVADLIYGTSNPDFHSGVYEYETNVDGYNLIIGDDGKVSKVRDTEGDIVYDTDSEEVKTAISKYEANPDKYEGSYELKGKALYGVTTQTVSDAIPMMAISAMTAGSSTGIVAGSMLTSYGGYYDEHFEETGDRGASTLYAGLTSGLIGIVESKIGKLERKFGKAVKGTNEPLRSYLSKTAKEVSSKNAKNVLDGNINFGSVLAEFTKRVGADLGGEYVEEFSNFPVEALTSTIFGRDYEVTTEDMATTALVTPFASAGFSIPANATGNRDRIAVREYESLVSNDYDKVEKAFNSYVSASGKTGDELSKLNERKDRSLKLIKELQEFEESAEEMDLSSSQKEKVDLLKRKYISKKHRALEAKTETATKSYEEEANILKDKIFGILENPKKESNYSINGNSITDGEYNMPGDKESGTVTARAKAKKYIDNNAKAIRDGDVDFEIENDDLLNKYLNYKVYGKGEDPTRELESELQGDSGNTGSSFKDFIKEGGVGSTVFTDQDSDVSIQPDVADSEIDVDQSEEVGSSEGFADSVIDEITSTTSEAISDRIDNAEYIDINELDDATNELYDLWDKVESNDNISDAEKEAAKELIESRINKLEQYELATEDKIIPDTKTKTARGIRISRKKAREAKKFGITKERFEKAAKKGDVKNKNTGESTNITLNENGDLALNDEVSKGSPYTRQDGTQGLGVKHNGRWYQLNDNGERTNKVVPNSNIDEIESNFKEDKGKYINFDNLTFRETTKDENGNLQSVTVYDPLSDTEYEITDPELALDIAIKAKMENQGWGYDVEFETVYEETIVPERVEKELVREQKEKMDGGIVEGAGGVRKVQQRGADQDIKSDEARSRKQQLKEDVQTEPVQEAVPEAARGEAGVQVLAEDTTIPEEATTKYDGVEYVYSKDPDGQGELAWRKIGKSGNPYKRKSKSQEEISNKYYSKNEPSPQEEEVPTNKIQQLKDRVLQLQEEYNDDATDSNRESEILKELDDIKRELSIEAESNSGIKDEESDVKFSKEGDVDPFVEILNQINNINKAKSKAKSTKKSESKSAPKSSSPSKGIKSRTRATPKSISALTKVFTDLGFGTPKQANALAQIADKMSKRFGWASFSDAVPNVGKSTGEEMESLGDIKFSKTPSIEEFSDLESSIRGMMDITKKLIRREKDPTEKARLNNKLKELKQILRDVKTAKSDKVRYSKGKNNRGSTYHAAAYAAGTAKATMYALESPNVAAGIHELWHLLPETILSKRQINFLLNKYNKWARKNGIKEESEYNTNVSEYFAKAWEEYWRSDKDIDSIPETKGLNESQKSTLQEIFDTMSEAIKSIYDSTVKYLGRDVDLDPELKTFFDSLSVGKPRTKESTKSLSTLLGVGNKDMGEFRVGVAESVTTSKLLQEALDYAKKSIFDSNAKIDKEIIDLLDAYEEDDFSGLLKGLRDRYNELYSRSSVAENENASVESKMADTLADSPGLFDFDAEYLNEVSKDEFINLLLNSLLKGGFTKTLKNEKDEIIRQGQQREFFEGSQENDGVQPDKQGQPDQEADESSTEGKVNEPVTSIGGESNDAPDTLYEEAKDPNISDEDKQKIKEATIANAVRQYNNILRKNKNISAKSAIIKAVKDNSNAIISDVELDNAINAKLDKDTDNLNDKLANKHTINIKLDKTKAEFKELWNTIKSYLHPYGAARDPLYGAAVLDGGRRIKRSSDGSYTAVNQNGKKLREKDSKGNPIPGNYPPTQEEIEQYNEIVGNEEGDKNRIVQLPKGRNIRRVKGNKYVVLDKDGNINEDAPEVTSREIEKYKEKLKQNPELKRTLVEELEKKAAFTQANLNKLNNILRRLNKIKNDLSPANQKVLLDVLNGGSIDLVRGVSPQELKEINALIEEARVMISGLQDKIPEYLIGPGLFDIIMDSKGTYTARFYKKDLDKDWHYKVKKDERVWNNAKKLYNREIQKRLRADKSMDDKLRRSWVSVISSDENLDSYMTALLTGDKYTEKKYRGSDEFYKNVSPFKRKKLGDDEDSKILREFYGEYTDIDPVLVDTVTKISNIVASTRFAEAFMELAEEGVHYSRTKRDNWVSVNKSGALTKSPLEKDIYLHPDIYDMVKREKRNLSAAAKIMSFANAASKAVAVVYSPLGILKNIEGAKLINMANGVPPFGGKYNKKARDIMRHGHKLKGQKGYSEEISAEDAKLDEKGLKGGGISYSELEALAGQASGFGEDIKGVGAWVKSIKEVTRKASKKTGVSYTADKAKDAFRWGDDFHRIALYYSMLDKYAKLYHGVKDYESLSPGDQAMADTWATEKALSMYHNYERLPDIVKALRNISVIAPFVSFPLATIMVSYSQISHYYGNLTNKHPDPEVRKRLTTDGLSGIARLASIASLSMFGHTLYSLLSEGLGYEESEEKNEDLRAPWETSLAFTDNLSKGKYEVVNYNSLNPYGYIFDAINPLIGGAIRGDFVKGVQEGMGNLLDPFISTQIPVGNALDNMNKLIRSDDFRPSNVAGIFANFMTETFVPLWRYVDLALNSSKVDEVELMIDPDYKKEKMWREIKSITGLRLSERSYHNAFRYNKGAKFLNEKRNIILNAKDEFESKFDSKATPFNKKKVAVMHSKYNKPYQEKLTELKSFVNRMKKNDLNNDEIKEIMLNTYANRSNFTKAEMDYLLGFRINPPDFNLKGYNFGEGKVTNKSKKKGKKKEANFF